MDGVRSEEAVTDDFEYSAQSQSFVHTTLGSTTAQFGLLFGLTVLAALSFAVML